MTLRFRGGGMYVPGLLASFRERWRLQSRPEVRAVVVSGGQRGSLDRTKPDESSRGGSEGRTSTSWRCQGLRLPSTTAALSSSRDGST